MLEENICLLTDSYKVCHHYFYPEGTEKLYSYLESRSGAIYNKTVFYGLQYILKKYLEGKVVTEKKIDEAEKVICKHIGENVFNRKGWEYILDEHDGYLPLEIKAVPEGIPVDVGNVLMTVVNTDNESFWLPNYLEPLLLQVWYPSTVATLSAEIRKLLNFYLHLTADDDSNLDFMLHDFGFRGASSVESSRLGGSAHLLSFKGTDTLSSLSIPVNYYNYPDIVGFSVQATEHSVMTSMGEDDEFKQVCSVIENANNGVLSLVIDSYNYRNFLKNCTKGRIYDKINEFLDKSEDNKIVFRPDSGEPVSTTLDCLDILSEGFDTYYNSKGYEVFDLNIGLLWGDGLDYQKIRDILFSLKNNNWSVENIIFGMGGGLHTNVNRDTQRNAFKCSAQYRNGEWIDISKNPLDSSKKSKTGRFQLVRENTGHFRTISLHGNFKLAISSEKDFLKPVFKDGMMCSEISFEDIRGNIKEYWRNL